MAHFIVAHVDCTCFLFSGDHKVSEAFMFSSLKTHFFQQSCPEWDFDRSLTADSNAVKQPGPKTEVCLFFSFR